MLDDLLPCEFGLIGADSENLTLLMFVFSIIKNFLESFKRADSSLSDPPNSRKELMHMEKACPLRIFFSFLAQNVWTIGIPIMTGVLSAQTHTVFKIILWR